MNTKDHDLHSLREAVSKDTPWVFFIFRQKRNMPNNPIGGGILELKQPGIGEVYLTDRIIKSLKSCEAFIQDEGIESVVLPLHSGFIHYVTKESDVSWVSLTNVFRSIKLKVFSGSAVLTCQSTENRALPLFESSPVKLTDIYRATPEVDAPEDVI